MIFALDDAPALARLLLLRRLLLQLATEPPDPDADDSRYHEHHAGEDNERQETQNYRRGDDQRADHDDEYVGERVARRDPRLFIEYLTTAACPYSLRL